MAGTAYFTKGTFRFLADLKKNNTKEWFAANKARYEAEVKDPALHFIQDFAPQVSKLSAHFHAGPRSLFRIHRDVRFSKDKSPYKTHTGIHFRHDRSKDAHAPGYYFHIEPGTVFVGLGLWRPDGPSVRAIRELIVEEPELWKKASRGRKYTSQLTPAGDKLIRGPKGFDPDHPLIEDLKWKDFIGSRDLDEDFATSPHLVKELAKIFASGQAYMAFLCKALRVPF